MRSGTRGLARIGAARRASGLVLMVVAIGVLSVPAPSAGAVPLGEITEFNVPVNPDPDYGSASPFPLSVTAGPDGNLWYTKYMNGQIGRLSTTGTVTEFPLPTKLGRPVGIAAGPDGNLWFAIQGTTPSKHAIGRSTPSGTITEFPIPTTAVAEEIAPGSDGNLWFTEPGGNRIGRITPSGSITEYPVTTAASFPIGITAGSDGNVWFSESDGNQIGRITPAGDITEFPIPTAASEPGRMTLGPDGNVWFTQYGKNRVGRITPAGVVTEFPIPTADSRPRGIISGPDGNLWVSMMGGPRIARVTPTGVITEYPTLNTFDQPNAIAVGSDNNLWFTLPASSIVARFGIGDLPAPVQPPSAPPPASTTAGTGSAPKAPSAVAARLANPPAQVKVKGGTVKVRCAAAAGTITSCRIVLSFRGKVIATGKGVGAQISLKLNASAQKLLRKARSRTIAATLKLVAQSAGGPVTLTRAVKLKR